MAANNETHATPPPATPQHAPIKSAGGKPGKGHAVMKLVLVFFISLFSFAVGTYVGKTYSDQRHKTAKLEPKNHIAIADQGNQHGEKSAEDSHESGHGDAHTAENQHGEKAHGEQAHGPAAREIASAGGSQEVMTDEEIARLAEEYVKDDEAPTAKSGHGEEPSAHSAAAATEAHDAHAPAKAKTAAAHAVVAKNPILPEDADSKYERNPAASPTKKKIEAMHESIEKNTKPEAAKGRKPSSLPANPIQDSIGKYTVQIASFATEDEAKQRAAQLRNQGYNAFYVQALVKGNVWYRVGIGLFNTERDAKNYMVDYRKGNSAIQAIVQKISAE